ncbi:ribonuclease [Altererythrobacter aerius]|uniref:Ribonuclease n=1 Tax=Tsuneonella aeria TaxID=1837929 RepID=A0A6I4TE34_9SPHN|nr:ribonuclease E/G [Tsuneonella aeria]MXO74917.1 ribonuclease [Tsuneonella aeria]
MTWLVEQGIGEERALRYENGQAVAARLRWPGALEAGMVAEAVLTERIGGTPRGRARFADGEEALVDRLPKDASEGAAIRLEVTRAAVAERGRGKPAQARPSDAPTCPAPGLPQALESAAVVRRFPDRAWDDIWSDAWEAAVAFPGGTLHLAPTAAMTLIDVDGALPARALALAAVEPAAQAMRRFDLGGSIGIDFPTLQAKADRQAVDAALSEALAGWPHESTAMNGFGFVQIVARSTGPSLLHRLAFDRTGAAARHLLRRAEMLDGAGAILLTAAPPVIAAIRPEWLSELERRTGRAVRSLADPALAIGGGHAQIVPR